MNSIQSNKFITSSKLSSHFLVILSIIFLLLLPFIINDPYIWGILVMANIYAAFGISFDLLFGFTGLAVLGFGLFVGIGAYASAFMNLYLNIPPLLTMPISGLIGAVFGLLIGIPCLRLKGLYLALASFAASAICEKLVIVFNDFTQGREGLSGLSPISYNSHINYYTSLILLLISAGILLMIVKSRIGMILKSICDDEVAAKGVGLNTNWYKLLTFLISSFLGGFWGSFLGHYMMHVGPGVFGLHTAITIFMVTIVGGIRTIIGPIGGAYLLIIMNELLRGMGEIRLLIYSIITIAIYLLLPHGIIGPIIDNISNGLQKIFVMAGIKNSNGRGHENIRS